MAHGTEAAVPGDKRWQVHGREQWRPVNGRAWERKLSGQLYAATAGGPRLRAEKHSFPFWLAEARMMQGWAMSRQGDAEGGLELLRQGRDEREPFEAARARMVKIAMESGEAMFQRRQRKGR